MMWLERSEAWIAKQSKILVLKSAIALCDRIVYLHDQIDYLEWSDMARLAEAVRPKIEKELKEVRHERNYYQDR